MKRIGNSKEPTPARMLAVVENLRERFKCYCSMSVSSNAHSDMMGGMDYGIYIASLNPSWIRLETWPEVISKYRELMKEDSNAS